MNLYKQKTLDKDLKRCKVGYIIKFFMFRIRINPKNVIVQYGNVKRTDQKRRVVKRHNNKFWTQKEIDKLIKLHNEEMYVEDIANHLGRTIDSVRSMERRIKHKLIWK